MNFIEVLRLLGCDVETIDLHKKNSGSMFLGMWNKLLRYQRNGFVMGAESKSAYLADRGLLDSGVMFDATYTIYNLREVDGIRLLQIRNPSGNHKEWEGDYSDSSPLWSRRLKHKLEHVKARDNLFWIELSDFCNIFRFLIICKWYDSKKWNVIEYSGQWSLRATGVGAVESEWDREFSSKAPSMKVERFYCTAGGLPSLAFQGISSRAQDNPYYSLSVFQATELRISAKQTTEFGQIPANIHAFGIYILNGVNARAERYNDITGDSLVAGTGCAKRERLLSLDAVLLPGIYVILVALLNPGTEGFFNLKILSDRSVESKQIWPPSLSA